MIELKRLLNDYRDAILEVQRALRQQTPIDALEKAGNRRDVARKAIEEYVEKIIVLAMVNEAKAESGD